MNINIASLDASAEKLEQQVKTQKLALLNAMGRTQSELFLTDKLSVDNRSKADPEGDALKNSTTLRLLEEQVQLKDMQETLAGQSRLPTVVAFAKYGTEGTSEHFDFYENTSDKFTDTGVLGVQIDVPIFDGMSSSNAKSKARIEKRQLQIDLEKKKIAIQADVSNAKTALATARSQVERQIANTKLSEENYQMKELEYKEQVASLSDLLTAESNVLSARSNLAEALYNEKTAELNLEQALGQISQRGE
jgi:outer membrane protein TolC